MMKFYLFMFMMNFMMMVKNFCSIYYNVMFLMSFFFLFMMVDSGPIMMGLSMNYFGLDFYSLLMMMLSVWILGLMFMSIDGNLILFKSLMFMLLGFILLGYFSSLNLVFFYIFFELSLIPTFFIIIYLGASPERVEAGMYMLIYTLLISLPLMIYIFYIGFKFHSYNINLITISMMSSVALSIFDYFVLLGAFLIKLPVYLFHLWLPKAHVEAPVYGSMILAAILLKLGSYGLIRIMLIFYKGMLKYNYIIIGVSVVGMMLVSIMCLSQIDLKSLVAYSSVVHMNFLLAAMMMMTNMGFLGAFIMMVGHGLCSSGLFYMVNLFYKKTGSRVIFFNKGIMLFMIKHSFWWFFLCSANFSFPFSLNFFCEVFMIISIISINMWLMMYVGLMCFFSSAFSLYLFSYVYHGMFYSESFMSGVLVSESMVLVLHVYPLGFMLANMILFL